MKKYLFVWLLGIFINCTNQQKSNVVHSKENEKENTLNIKDSLFFNDEDKIVGVSHFENNIQEGFSLILDEKTNIPKYLVQYTHGKRDKIIIAFDNDGKMKSFRSSDIHNDSQSMKFHKNGVIKEIGNTIKGKANGICYYFDEEGKQISKVLYDNGNIVK
ncbi:hypothetical protein CJ739_982 [Mariniflexile rhizosphaerae]|uniref:hypothetical protein n=1 Tax=unclassified Mariniflexile TaxID=2643887 RepID=UPI000E334693|nr:hypothetical protein [Mariniflexile sp. TRM1-10]AXP80075.1 hypothetical protein CJ739_982 [Mariniflexile sp. TRM1-10]